MFEKLQSKLLNKVLGKPKEEPKKKRKTRKSKQDFRSDAGRALDDAVNKLEGSGIKLDAMMADNEELLAQVKAEAAKKMTPERRALIESAQKVRKAKAKILEDLDDETRAKLYLTAIRAFTGRQ